MISRCARTQCFPRLRAPDDEDWRLSVIEDLPEADRDKEFRLASGSPHWRLFGRPPPPEGGSRPIEPAFRLRAEPWICRGLGSWLLYGRRTGSTEHAWLVSLKDRERRWHALHKPRRCEACGGDVDPATWDEWLQTKPTESLWTCTACNAA